LGRGLDRYGDPVTALRRGLRAQPPAEPPSPVRQHPTPRVHPPLAQADLPLRHRRPGGTPDGSALSIRVPTAPIYRVTTATTRSCPTTAVGRAAQPSPSTCIGERPLRPTGTGGRSVSSTHGSAWSALAAIVSGPAIRCGTCVTAPLVPYPSTPRSECQAPHRLACLTARRDGRLAAHAQEDDVIPSIGGIQAAYHRFARPVRVYPAEHGAAARTRTDHRWCPCRRWVGGGLSRGSDPGVPGVRPRAARAFPTVPVTEPA